MLLYTIYNAPLIRIANPNNPNEHIIGFVDDTTLLASGKDFDKAHSIIKNMMECENGVFEWSRSYNSPLEMSKLALVNFSLSSKKATRASPLTLTHPDINSPTTHRLMAKPHTKLLGILLNSKLTWKAQYEKVCEKAIKWTAAFK